MKQFKRVLAIVLALVMILSCVGAALATDKTAGRKLETVSDRKDNAKGYKSAEFKSMNTYRYTANETVRAIVVLSGAPEADVAERNSEKAISQRARLMGEHERVRKAMSGIDFKLLYDYTALLDGFACEVAYGDLDKIAAIEGVKAVYIANHYDLPEVEKSKDLKMGYASLITENEWCGFDGDGVVVAVLDTGLRVTHEAFQDTDLTETLTKDDVSKADAEGKYYSAKIPFAYDYADLDNDPSDHDGHGTHVSGIIGGYVEESDGAITFHGGAPKAQILAMKIFSDDQPGTDSTIYFYALEDAYKLGADVINMSIGAQNGFTFDAELETEEFGNMYKRLEDAGIVCCIAAGNEYSMNEYSSVGYIGPEYPDYGTVGSPATYDGNTSVASIENIAYPSYYIEIDGERISYTDSSEDAMWRTTFGGKELDYVVIPDSEDPTAISLGYEDDFKAVNCKGKIAVVQRGDITFEEKADAAYAAGAIGCIVVNNQPGVISMAIETFEIPAVSVPQDSAEIFLAGSKLTVSTDMYDMNNPLALQMSDFSCWGTTPDLTIDPAVTSVGGNVYSSVNTADDAYEVYSGTSMACPNAAATFANVLQALKEDGISDKAERAELARDLLESTAWIFSDLDGYLYSVRKQGAGLIQSATALVTYQNAAYITNPLQELGDDKEKTGKYSFEVELKNDTDADVEYQFAGIAMYDYIADDNEGVDGAVYYNTLTSDYLDAQIEADGTTGSTCYWAQYSDCKDEWYHEYVDYVCYAGLMNGVAEGKFAPNDSMTRAMAVTVLYRMAGSPTGFEPASFSDVPAGAWYADAVAWAQAWEVVNGTSATTFSPDAKITREQLATILWRYYGEQDADISALNDFTDGAKVSDYAKTAMAWAVENGILNGDGGKLLPTDNATRAQYAAIITRIMGGYYDCEADTIVIPANSTKKVKVTITLSEGQKAYLDEIFPNGSYVEGYVEFGNAEYAAHATYLAFYGDWTQAPVLEAADFRDLIEADIYANTEVIDEDGNTNADLGYSGFDFLDYYTSPNMAYSAVMAGGIPQELVWYLGDNLYDYVPFYEQHISFSTEATNATYISANGIYMEPYQLRNCDHLIMTISDSETKEVYFVDDTPYLPKAYYDTDYSAWAANGVFYWDGTDADGNFVPSGTIAHVQFDAVLPYGDTEVKDVWSYDVLVDYTAPVIEDVKYDASSNTLTVTASDDNYLQAIVLYGDDDQALDAFCFSSDKAGESFTATFELDWLAEYGYEQVYVSAVDYATNETIPGTEEEYDTPFFYIPDEYTDDFSGEYAIAGLPFDYDEYDFIYDEPVMLDANGKYVDSTKATDIVAEDFCFETERTDIVYTFIEVDEGVYTIQNNVGKYLADVDGEIGYIDTPEENALWIIFTDDYGMFPYIYNYSGDNLMLLYIDDEGEFALMDDFTPIGSDDEGDIYPSDCYCTWLYVRETGSYTPELIDISGK